MTRGHRASSEQQAVRINAASELLRSELGLLDVIGELAARFQLSERQARRYVERARSEGTVAVPEPNEVFTVKLPGSLIQRLRDHAHGSGRTFSSVVAQALTEFLDRVRAGHRGGQPAR